MGQATGAFFATQIGAWQSAHLRWTDDTFGFGMSVTREQTMHMRSPMAYNIALASSELDFNAANVTKSTRYAVFARGLVDSFGFHHQFIKKVGATIGLTMAAPWTTAASLGGIVRRPAAICQCNY